MGSPPLQTRNSDLQAPGHPCRQARGPSCSQGSQRLVSQFPLISDHPTPNPRAPWDRLLALVPHGDSADRLPARSPLTLPFTGSPCEAPAPISHGTPPRLPLLTETPEAGPVLLSTEAHSRNTSQRPSNTPLLLSLLTETLGSRLLALFSLRDPGSRLKLLFLTGTPAVPPDRGPDPSLTPHELCST